MATKLTRAQDIDRLARTGYAAYYTSGSNPGKTFDGRQMPTWDELGSLPHGEETRTRWRAAAAAIRGSLKADNAKEGGQ